MPDASVDGSPNFDENAQIDVNETHLLQDDVQKQIAIYAEDPCNTKEDLVDLYVKRGCAVCDHLRRYIEQSGAETLFYIVDVENIAPGERPPWLQGVPTAAVPCKNAQTLELFVGERALMFVRRHVEGPCSFGDDGESEDDELEVVDGSSGGGKSSISTNTEGFGRQAPRPEKAEDLLHFLLPLPLDPKAPLREHISTDGNISKESLAKVMAMRDSMLQ
jgi:hypothetical protein